MYYYICCISCSPCTLITRPTSKFHYYMRNPLLLCFSMAVSIENEIRIQQRIIQKRFIHVRKIIPFRIYWWLFDRVLYVSFYGTWMGSKALRHQYELFLLLLYYLYQWCIHSVVVFNLILIGNTRNI
jgi:hypothetical protein